MQFSVPVVYLSQSPFSARWRSCSGTS
jgi:hypothetical protein